MRGTERPDMPWQTNWDLRNAAWWCYTLRARYPLYMHVPQSLVFRLAEPTDVFDMPPTITVWCGPEAFLPTRPYDETVARPTQMNTYMASDVWAVLKANPDLRQVFTDDLVHHTGLKAAWLYEGIPQGDDHVLLIWKVWR